MFSWDTQLNFIHVTLTTEQMIHLSVPVGFVMYFFFQFPPCVQSYKSQKLIPLLFVVYFTYLKMIIAETLSILRGTFILIMVLSTVLVNKHINLLLVYSVYKWFLCGIYIVKYCVVKFRYSAVKVVALIICFNVHFCNI